MKLYFVLLFLLALAKGDLLFTFVDNLPTEKTQEKCTQLGVLSCVQVLKKTLCILIGISDCINSFLSSIVKPVLTTTSEQRQPVNKGQPKPGQTKLHSNHH
jgi:hypothetical protein